jgi:hypothetical protein
MCVKFDYYIVSTPTRTHVITTSAQDRHTHTHTLSLTFSHILSPQTPKRNHAFIAHRLASSLFVLRAECFSSRCDTTHATHFFFVACSASERDPLGCDPSVVDTADGHTPQPTLSYASTYIRVRVSADCMRVLARRAPVCACVGWLQQKQRDDVAIGRSQVAVMCR